MKNNFLKQKFKIFNLNLTLKQNRSEAPIFKTIINNNEQELFVTSIDLDTQRSIKIAKQDLGELKDNLFIALVLIIDKESRVIYLIPSKDLSLSDSSIFIENKVSLMPSLSNWEIKVSSSTIPILAKYSLENMIEKLRS